MKLFVKVDFWVQVTLYILLFLSATVFGFIGYFFVLLGIWQLVSSIILTQIFEDRLRSDYLKFAGIYLLISPFFMISIWIIPIIYALGAFGFSIWYFRLTYFHHRRLQTTFRSFWDLEI